MHTIFVSKLFSFSETTFLFLPLKWIWKMEDFQQQQYFLTVKETSLHCRDAAMKKNRRIKKALFKI